MERLLDLFILLDCICLPVFIVPHWGCKVMLIRIGPLSYRLCILHPMILFYPIQYSGISRSVQKYWDQTFNTRASFRFYCHFTHIFIEIKMNPTYTELCYASIVALLVLMIRSTSTQLSVQYGILLLLLSWTVWVCNCINACVHRCLLTTSEWYMRLLLYSSQHGCFLLFQLAITLDNV